MVDYNAQVNQIPTPYVNVSASGSKKRKIGAAMAGALIGMNAYYLPVSKNSFINRAFDITKMKAEHEIDMLKNIAEEVANDKVSTQSKMILQDMGLAEDVFVITNKCSALERSVAEPVNVKNLKADFASNFKSYKKDVSLMDNTCAEAFRAIKRNKFKWGAGIGAAIGLALGLLTSRD